MPPIRQHTGSSSVASYDQPQSQANGTGAKNVWFYMTGATTPTRPDDEDLQSYFDEDNERQRSKLTYQRPKEIRIRCVVCLLEKDKWQTWHNRPGPIAKLLRQHLDGRHAIICTEDAGDPNVEPQQSSPATNSPAAKNKPAPVTSSTKPAGVKKSQASGEAPRSTHSKTVSTSKLPSPSCSTDTEQPQREEVTKPRPRAPKSVEKLRAELDRVKAECEQAKAERDQEARERRLLKEELRRLKESERARDQELVRLSNLLSSSLQALIKK